ncbi:hypothetical protein MMC07_004154 [Pseudocyphellaria aurata]|nr:hypothetical protein [Pseudocyphellaria aurata]
MGPKSRKPTKQSKRGPLQQHQNDISRTPVTSGRTTQKIVQSRLKAAVLLILAAAYSPISQLTLSPVYGSIPSSIQHERLTAATVLLAGTLMSRTHAPIMWHLISLLPVLAFSIPAIQFFLFQHSNQLGPVYGPLVTEAVTYCPLVFMSVLGSVELIYALRLRIYGEIMMKASVAALSYASFSILKKFSVSLLKRYIGSGLGFTRLGMQVLLSAFYAILLPSRLLLIAVFPLLHMLLWNVHSPLAHTTAVLNSTLKEHNYSLVARQESQTGYISVLDNTKEGFRVMRCDHSLLGGEWIPQQKKSPSQLNEPIYAIFVMLEAVRLVETQSTKNFPSIPDHEKHSLVIGLGVGTTPSAMIAHGIHTTIVEIDPIVHDYATKHFSLPLNHTKIIEDATVFIDRMEAQGAEREIYDYIIHDVFTGGAEPVELFTEEFLRGLSNSLSVNGVIAINYAGDLLLPSASIIVHTIKSVFPSCRIYREDAAPDLTAASRMNTLKRDFTNMVIFCRKSNETFTFRNPTEADYLKSGTRRYHLLPQHEIDAAVFEKRDEFGNLEILKRGRTKKIQAYHKDSALGHWDIMRTVLPNSLWEDW